VEKANLLNGVSCLSLKFVGGDATLLSCGLVTSSVLGQPLVENQFPSFSLDGANVRPFAMLVVQRGRLFT